MSTSELRMNSVFSLGEYVELGGIVAEHQTDSARENVPANHKNCPSSGHGRMR